MFTTIRKTFRLLSPGERRELAWLLPLNTILALIQVVGITSIMPFLALLAEPGAIKTNRILQWLYVTFGFTSDTSFLFFTGVAALVMFTFSNLFSMLVTWLVLRFAWMRNHTLSSHMLSSFLYGRYEQFLHRNTIDAGTTMLSEVQQAVNAVLIPAIQMIAMIVVAAFILALLVVVNPMLALVSTLVLGTAYFGVFLFTRSTLTRLGNERVLVQKKRHRLAHEALAGLREIALAGKEQAFLERYTAPSRRYARNMSIQQTIETLPRYALETIAFGGMLVIVLYLLSTGHDLSTMLPVLGLYVLASYRLLPALQQIFRSAATLRFNAGVVDALLADLQPPELRPAVDRSELTILPFRRDIVLDDVSYTYPGSDEATLEAVHMTIQAGTSVALVGATGSGKTTVANLLLGLLRPKRGRLLVDGTPVDDDNLPSWQMNMGYIPQNIYLFDDTIARNIAFGVADEAVDREAVRRAAQQAKIHDFILRELPDGYDTVVGERGIRLSGGQRQRLGIARALYTDPDVLLLDEATSALDSMTESDVMQSILDVPRSRTTIIIAHRLSTVRECDELFVFDAGRVVARGSFDELMRTCPLFRRLTQNMAVSGGAVGPAMGDSVGAAP